jgi:pimeloyl-[acyl-carrier protein] methyl ester esterase
VNWILIRGLSRNAEHWGSFRDLLKTATNDSVITVDLPGFGAESDTNFSLSLRENIDFLRSKNFPHLQSKHNCIIGLSFGGMVALEWIKLYPSDFTFGVIMNSSASGLCNTNERISKKGIYTIVKNLYSLIPEAKEQQILELTSNHHAGDKQIARQWVEIENRYPTNRVSVLKQLLVSALFKAPHDLKIPLLFLGSQNDGLVSSRCTLKLAKFYQAPVSLHPTAGHDLPLDAPDWVIKNILTFKNKTISS